MTILIHGSMCATPGCGNAQVGNSKYCEFHRKAARKEWLRKIAESKDQRVAQEKWFKGVVEEANLAAELAVNSHKPEPMVVQEHALPFDDGSPVKQEWVVPGGVCGFAWVVIRPGNHPFANYCKKHLDAKPAYNGGTQVWCPLMTQSMSTKETWCRAWVGKVVELLGDDGVRIHTYSRMD